MTVPRLHQGFLYFQRTHGLTVLVNVFLCGPKERFVLPLLRFLRTPQMLNSAVCRSVLTDLTEIWQSLWQIRIEIYWLSQVKQGFLYRASCLWEFLCWMLRKSYGRFSRWCYVTDERTGWRALYPHKAFFSYFLKDTLIRKESDCIVKA
jgi:hypothetical protein